jgi:hypothetical protein
MKKTTTMPTKKAMSKKAKIPKASRNTFSTASVIAPLFPSSIRRDNSANPSLLIPGAKKEFVWQYKGNGNLWENYEARASDAVEEIFLRYKENRGDTDVRAIKSGDWEYQVDFLSFKQTNIQHENHRIRDIRRIPNDRTKANS